MEIEVLALSGCAGIERTLPGGLDALYQVWQFAARHDFLQGFRVLQEGIPYFETAHVEVEAPTHGLVNGDDTISDFRC